MKYLLDTGVWLRGVTEKESIPAESFKLLQITGELYALSAISLWEIGKKVQIGKLELAKDLSGWFGDALAPNIFLLPLSPEIVADAMRLPDFPNRNPADELIVATARIYNLTLITTDTKLKNYRHARISYFKPKLETD
ncbi:MAG TPA: type II toxin-antitoxin system VapC family toxin [Verrucomicrobiae bacterium]|nr:type II toxin-antitoxin system VapC family toxin [Verrucomicrobiae bacterium]